MRYLSSIESSHEIKSNREAMVLVNPNVGTTITKLRDFTIMNPPKIVFQGWGRTLRVYWWGTQGVDDRGSDTSGKSKNGCLST